MFKRTTFAAVSLVSVGLLGAGPAFAAPLAMPNLQFKNTDDADSTPADDCKSIDLADTDFGSYADSGRIPVTRANEAPTRDGTSDIYFHFKQIEDNQFDPCGQLSWVTVSGENGKIANPDGKSTSEAEAVLLFDGSKLIKHIKPTEADRIAEVKRLEDNVVQVIYEYSPAGDGNAAHTKRYTDVFKLENGEVKVTNSTYPQTGNVMKLDFSKPAVPGNYAKLRYGNKYRTGFDTVVPRADDKPVTPVVIELDDNATLYCVVPKGDGTPRWGDDMACQLDPNPGWKEFPRDNSNARREPPQGSGGSNNAFAFSFNPDVVLNYYQTSLTATAVFSGAATAHANGVTLVDKEMVVDTREGGAVKITRGVSDHGITVTKEGVSYM
ncbi:LppP/LprE family lipoprotein [Corynebacterium ulceribovis]|uniref:LppP/LprE family lipoprotein n=1 Tax=Corynebacterium ulceribovis TaxID=487732 RepID=UPI0003612045|nr:LppP/LprE family lipoprotein [Corynebacterium ulceribovis]